MNVPTIELQNKTVPDSQLRQVFRPDPWESFETLQIRAATVVSKMGYQLSSSYKLPNKNIVVWEILALPHLTPMTIQTSSSIPLCIAPKCIVIDPLNGQLPPKLPCMFFQSPLDSEEAFRLHTTVRLFRAGLEVVHEGSDHLKPNVLIWLVVPIPDFD